ncbi:hypothetical protein [Embleya sp. NPDC050493]|uniref:hypothetical protein n=1 Tax=Embleya sp. NPDC050493 TaxID=3363989 RepID=UPI00379C3F8C
MGWMGSVIGSRRVRVGPTAQGGHDREVGVPGWPRGGTAREPAGGRVGLGRRVGRAAERSGLPENELR